MFVFFLQMISYDYYKQSVLALNELEFSNIRLTLAFHCMVVVGFIAVKITFSRKNLPLTITNAAFRM